MYCIKKTVCFFLFILSYDFQGIFHYIIVFFLIIPNANTMIGTLLCFNSVYVESFFFFQIPLLLCDIHKSACERLFQSVYTLTSVNSVPIYCDNFYVHLVQVQNILIINGLCFPDTWRNTFILYPHYYGRYLPEIPSENSLFLCCKYKAFHLSL